VAPAPDPGRSWLFEGGGLSARELARPEVPALQAFYDANPEYFQTVNGRPPAADAAAIEFDERPPEHLGYTRQWCLGLFDRSVGGGLGDELAGIVMLTSDLCRAGVWHLGLFIVATRLHGSGAAVGLHAALEDWVKRCGAIHLRLGVVRGNARAERFWQRLGYVQLREREGVDTGGRINTIHVMLKPLGEEGIEAHLQAAPRDRPGSSLP
jgi:GNAT superfamily N-acetyltransferase